MKRKGRSHRLVERVCEGKWKEDFKEEPRSLGHAMVRSLSLALRALAGCFRQAWSEGVMEERGGWESVT